MAVAGASRFLGAATLANTRGISAQSQTLLGQGGNTQSILDAGRGISSGGFGLSASARALNNQFLNRSTEVNGLFSLAAGTDATVESAQQEILALRAGLSDAQLARSLRPEPPAEETVPASEQGQIVDEEA